MLNQFAHFIGVRILAKLQKLICVQEKKGCEPAQPWPTALLSPISDGKPEADTAVVVAPDDGHEDAQNMLSGI